MVRRHRGASSRKGLTRLNAVPTPTIARPTSRPKHHGADRWRE